MSRQSRSEWEQKSRAASGRLARSRSEEILIQRFDRIADELYWSIRQKDAEIKRLQQQLTAARQNMQRRCAFPHFIECSP
ncbi:uncharacterized protein LOC135144213 isoform X3 [Zophobas morio]|uniref:uncharacterized protein LOC135144213 isoform X3 n=1 Tax=Zophobas morio TaxID=2755281 RepID=UPI0030831819